jgi:hypothetical protein
MYSMLSEKKIELIFDKLHKPVDRLGLPNDLVDRLIGGTMKLTIVKFG